MVTVAVLGHRGMLGRRVVQVLARSHHVITFSHRYPGGLIEAVEAAQPDWVVNCISGGWLELAVLPHELAARFRLIQPSTDAIGEDTDYARAKAAGEAGTVIRCSIVDPDGGLLAKVRDAGEFVATTDLWNGITALAWAGVADRIIRGDLDGPLIIPGSPPVTIDTLASTACRIFGWWTKVTQRGRTHDRALVPTLLMPPITDQLRGYL